MMTKDIRFISISIAISISLASQSTVTPDSVGRDIHLYLLAQYKTAEGALGQAATYYDLLMTDPNIPTAAYKGYTQFLILNNQYAKVLELLSKKKLDEEDPAVQLAIIEALEHTDNHKQAIDRLLNFAHNNTTNQELILKAAQAYLARHEPENAIQTIDSYLENAPQKPNLFLFHFFKAQILIQLNKKQEALTAIKQCLKAHSHFDKGWLLCAILEEQLGNLEGAIKGFSTFLDLVGQDKGIQQHLIQLMFRQKMLAEKTTTFNISLPCLEKAMLLFEQKKPKAALEQVEECLKQNPKDKDARLLKIQILGALNQQDRALACLSDWINENPAQELWFKTLLLMTNHGIMYSDAIHTLQLLEKKFPKAQLPVQYAAELYLRSEQDQQAVTYLNKLINMSKDASLLAKAYYQIAIIQYEQRQFDAMVGSCTKGLNLKPDFAPLCNLLAYYYTGKGHDIARAQRLITVALKAEPENPHYKDTQSHIYYKAKEYTKAYAILKPIAPLLPDDTHITKHLKKIRLQLAQK
jgi:tetratricopeptide (TPR) repeat protein